MMPLHITIKINYCNSSKIECIKNKNQPLVDCQKGFDSIAIGLAAQKSIETGEPVHLNNFL